MRSQQALHEAAQKFALGVVSDVEVPGVFLNDIMNNVQVPVVVMKNNTVGRKKNNVARKKNTCDIQVPDAARKFAFGVVSDVEVPGVLLNDNINNVDVPYLVLNKKTVGKKKKIF